jgi:hypothetical protein
MNNKLHKNKIPIGSFTDKWSLHDPIDPKEDNPNPFYFYPDNVPFMPAKSRGVKEGCYALTIDLDIRKIKTELMDEIEDIIDKEKAKIEDRKIDKNLFGEGKTQPAEYYKEVLYVGQLKLNPDEEYFYSEILKMGQDKGLNLKDKQTVINRWDQFQGFKK